MFTYTESAVLLQLELFDLQFEFFGTIEVFFAYSAKVCLIRSAPPKKGKFRHCRRGFPNSGGFRFGLVPPHLSFVVLLGIFPIFFSDLPRFFVCSRFSFFFRPVAERVQNTIRTCPEESEPPSWGKSPVSNPRRFTSSQEVTGQTPI